MPDPTTISIGELECRISETSSKVSLHHGHTLVYQFQRTDSGCILRWEDMSVCRRLYNWLDKRYGVVQREVSVGGERYTCSCDSPEIQRKRDWSDGMVHSFHFKCHNCGEGGSIRKNYKGEVSSRDFVKP